jgi:hypothetical protein
MKDINTLIEKIKNEAVITVCGKGTMATSYSSLSSGEERNKVKVEWRGKELGTCFEGFEYVKISFVGIDILNFHKNGIQDWMTEEDIKNIIQVSPPHQISYGRKFKLGEEIFD